MAFITSSGKPAGPIGQGTWYLGEHGNTFTRERDALRTGIEMGMTLIDTAEMYGEGAAETLVGEAIRGYDRESLYIVSKVYPFNAGKSRIFKSCEASLKRMGTDYMDLYLLHWRGSVPFAETVECMEELKDKGLIRAWGVSNLDTEDMQELTQVPGGANCATDQVLYNLSSRGIEYDLLPWLRERRMDVMAYCPLAQMGRLNKEILKSHTLSYIATDHRATVSQVMLAFLLAKGVTPIPRTSRPEHTQENADASAIHLTAEELEAIDWAFPAPRGKMPLEIV